MKPTNRLNVLQLITGLRVGGAERIVLEMASKMHSDTTGVSIFSLDSDRSILSQYAEMPFPIRSAGMSRSIFSFFRTMVCINKVISEENISVIHAHMFHSVVVAAFLKVLRPSVKIVFTSHNFSGFSVARRWTIFATKHLRFADIVFGLDQHRGLNSKNTVVIKNAVNVPKLFQRRALAKEADHVIFLFLGRFKAAKNPVEMVRLFSKMTNKNCKLLFAGGGDLQSAVESEIATHGLQHRVDLLGEVDDVPALLRRVDCLVMPSLWEGLPLAILEAGASGLPVIATPVGSVPEVLSNDCGYLCDISQFSKRMDDVVDDLDDAVKRGARLHSKIKESYSLDVMVEKHTSIYLSALGS